MKLASLFVEVGANVNNFERGMKNVRSEIDQTSKHASFFSNTLSTALGTGVTLAVNKAVSSLTEFVEFIKKTGEEFNSLKENSTLAFETMLGSMDQAKSFLAELQQFAEKTPFELPGLIDASQKMIAFGFTSKEVLPTLTAIGDAVSGLGGSPEKLQRVITAIGQIKAKGKIQAQEMLQLAEAGIPAWDMLAKAIGKTIPEAMKESEKGAIDATTAINALINGMNDRFGGLMAKQSQTFSGLRSTFNDLLRDVVAKLTKPWFDNAKKGLEAMIKLMQTDKFKSFLEGTIKVSEKLANTVARIKGFFFGLLGKGFNLLHALFGSSSEAKQSIGILDLIPKKIKQLMGFIEPIGNFIYELSDKGFRVLTGVFDDFYRSFNKISNQRFYFFGDMSLGQFASGIKSIFKEVTSGGKNLNYWLYTAPKVFQVITKLMMSAKNIFSYFSGSGLQTTLKSLGKILTGLGSTLAKLVRPFKDALGSLFSQLSTMKNLGFADIFKTVLSSIAQAFSGFIKVIKDEFWPTIKGALIWVWNALSDFFTSIDWGSVWTGITTGLASIVGYVASIDWASVWSTIWSSLQNIGQWFADNVIPPISNFFSWLLSWFSDPAKNSQLWNAITATWNFITDWASYLWSAVSPYLSSFFGYLASWFTDPSKRQTLWNAVVSTWNFVSDWALYLWEVTSPYLSGFFNYLLSWFTDPTKRGQLWNGIVATWNFVIEWAKIIGSSIAPYLTQFWNWLSGWFTDPSKRTQLWTGIVSTWNAITLWGSNLWGWLYPHMQSLWSNLKGWIDTNHPSFGSWIDEFTNTSTKIKDDWVSKWPLVTESFFSLATTIKTEVPLMVTALDSLFKTIAGESSSWTSMGDYFSDVAIFYNRYFEFIIKMARVTIELLNEMAATTKAAFSFDWNGYIAGSQRFGEKIGELGSLFSGFQNVYSGYATGGVVNEGRVLVGEKGPELVDLPRGSRVWDHGQSMGKLNQDSGQTVTIILKNEGTLQASRQVIDDIAIALQKRLNLQGNRVVFAS